MESFKQIDIHEAKKLIDEKSVTIVDVRDAATFQQAHIKDALNVNDVTIQKFIDETDKDKLLICICYHGMSSQGAANYFVENGFKDVQSVIGGFEEWRTEYDFVEGS